MKNINNKNKVLLFISMAITTSLPLAANAELYISPSVRDTVKIDNKANEALSNASDGAVVVGESTETGRFVMQEKTEKENKPYASGANVPLFFAIEANSPKDSGWVIHLEDGIKLKTVSWEDNSGNWEGTLKTIAKQNNLHVTINTEEKAIGFSSTEGLSQHLAMKVPDVWVLKQNTSLKASLTDWGVRAGWSVQWDSDLSIDYMIAHSATFTGQFVGEGGVVSQALEAISSSNVPLKAVFYKKNKVALITEAGYSQEVKY